MLKGTLRHDGHDQPATSENVVEALAGTGFFWLDLDDDTVDGTVAELLGVHFKFHPLTVQAAERFGQRPRIDDYSDFVYLVARGADPEKTGKAEVHCFWTDRYVVTVHRGDCPAVAKVHERLDRHPVAQVASPQIVVVYLIIGALVDSFFPFLSEFDERIDSLEDDILKAPTEAQLGELFDMKRTLMEMRKAIAPRARHDGEHQRRGHRRARHDRRGDPLLPRPLRPPDPAGGPGRQLPRPALQRHGHAPLDGVEPAERRDEAADHHRHDLPAAQLPHRLLRAELRLPGPGVAVADVELLRARDRARARRRSSPWSWCSASVAGWEAPPSERARPPTESRVA